MQFFTGISRNTQSKSYMLSWLNVSGNSEIMHCGILINMPYSFCNNCKALFRVFTSAHPNKNCAVDVWVLIRTAKVSCYKIMAQLYSYCSQESTQESVISSSSGRLRSVASELKKPVCATSVWILPVQLPMNLPSLQSHTDRLISQFMDNASSWNPEGKLTHSLAAWPVWTRIDFIRTSFLKCFLLGEKY